MLERKQKGILSLNLKELASRVNDLKIVLILQNEMLLLMLLCKRVLKQRDDIPKYGETINISFLGIACPNIFSENCSVENILMNLSAELVAKQFFFRHLLDNLLLF